MSKSNYLQLNRSLIILTATSILSLAIYFYNDSNFIQSIQKKWFDVKAFTTKPKNELDDFIQHRNEWDSKILDILKSELQSHKINYESIVDKTTFEIEEFIKKHNTNSEIQ